MIFKLLGRVTGGIAVFVIMLVLMVALSAAWWGFLLMILMGILHSGDKQVPALGYHICYLVGIPLSFVLG